MGVPSFNRWLVKKYSNIVVPATEDTSEPNPNAFEFDNLYLDLNAIIYPCFHPEDQLFPPTTVDEVFQGIFACIDRLFEFVQPRKLLYIAIDGVAPRDKMNQQRSRRFRNAKNAEISEAEEERLRREFEMQGKKVFPKIESEVSDSNIVTPGTEFMDKLSNALQCFIRLRLNNDPGWKNIKVILSDANVPGEGEHKIMSFIRCQRNLDDYDPNTRHCLYGLDADLIMLALATHEVHFSIPREQPSGKQAVETTLSKHNSDLVTSNGSSDKLHNENGVPPLAKKSYEFLNIWTLREYLEHDMKISEAPFEIDLERIIDDFIFICFFTGNDFLPCMPSIEIKEFGIDLLMFVYKTEFTSRGGYLVNMQRAKAKKAGYVNLERIEKFILSVGTHEDRIFKKRMSLRECTIRNILKRFSEEMRRDMEDLENEKEDPLVQAEIGTLDLNSKNICGDRHCAKGSTLGPHQTLPSDDQSDVLKNMEELKQRVKYFICEQADLIKQGGMEKDKVRLGMHGWKERYYREKFMCESVKDIESTRKSVVEKYTEGLCWVLQYYFFGVPSWTWFYPYYYGPFASDLKGLASVNVEFNLGTPFKPFEQLMAILPPKSVDVVPEAFKHLMTSEQSPLVQFYPTDFEVDAEGKRHLWQGIVKLPFIEEDQLLSEMKKLEKGLKEDEVERNSVSVNKIFVTRSHGLGSQVESIKQSKERLAIDTRVSGGMNGFLVKCNEDSCSAFYVEGTEDIAEDNVICGQYKCLDSHLHIPRLLDNVTIPEKKITEADIEMRLLWHEYEGFKLPTSLATNGGNLASSDSSSSKKTFQGAGSGLSAPRGRRYSESSTQNLESLRGIWGTNNTKLAPSGPCFGRGRWVSGRGNRQTESSWNRSCGSSHSQANGCKIAYPGPSSIGDGRAGSNCSQVNWRANGSHATSTSGRGIEANWRADRSYPALSSRRGSGSSGGNWVDSYWPSKNVPSDGRTNVWPRQDSL